MKVILLGSTGFIGAEVLTQALANPSITSIVALSRRELPDTAQYLKLTVVVVKDFKIYPENILEHLRSADACIWSMGTYNWDLVVELEYPEAFQQALVEVLNEEKKFRYIYLGGAFTEEDQKKSLWFFSRGRRVRGLAQTKFLEFGKQNPNIETHVVRPAGVVAKKRSVLLNYLLTPFPTVGVDDLAVVMVGLALNGGTEEIVLNKTIIEQGKKLLLEK